MKKVKECCVNDKENVSSSPNKTYQFMKKIVALVALAIIFAATVAAQENLSALLPYPNSVQTNAKAKPFRVTDKCAIAVQSETLAFAAEEMQRCFDYYFHFTPSLNAKGNIVLAIDTALEGDEHYLFEVDSKKVVIKGKTPRAVLYGVMTFRQLLMGDAVATRQAYIPWVKINDKPRYEYRALMLDPARHFLPVKDVKFFIDQMVLFKYNVLQLHLTDDQGWRIEIKKHPLLTEKGSLKGGFYTQAEMKDLIEYAALRGIEIIPEFDIPGHTKALLTSYPELGCQQDTTLTKQVAHSTLCAANQQCYQILKDVFEEMTQLFPSKYLHLGGDEAEIEKNWALCYKCRALMQERGYTQTAQLMNIFFGEVLHMVKELDKEPQLWCELNEVRMPADRYLFDYPQSTVLVTWRWGLTEKCNELCAQHGNRLIMAPGEHCYIDYPQYSNDLPEHNNWGMPTTTLERCYRLDPSYGLSKEEDKHILGVMGTLWGEAISTIHRACYMAFPRALAIAESGWSEMSQRSWDSFVSRMYPNLDFLARRGVSYRVPYEVVKHEK